MKTRIGSVLSSCLSTRNTGKRPPLFLSIFRNRRLFTTGRDTSRSADQVITCKAAVCWGPGEGVKLEEIQVAPPKPSEVRVKMLYASLCHTDVSCSLGVLGPLFPRVLGHEGVGVVERVGANVRGLKEGDVVIPSYVGECGECENCRSGKTNLCLEHPLRLHGLMGDGTSRMSIRGQSLYHFFSCSTWSEYMVSGADYLVKIDTRTALPHATLISCGFTTGYGAAWKAAPVHEGSSVAVLGLGTVGLGAVAGARDQGATRIIGIDKNERKREIGKTFGMTDFINPSDSDKSISELFLESTGGEGVHYGFECSGGIRSMNNELLRATKVGTGMLTVIGLIDKPNLDFDYLTLLLGRTIRGCVFGGVKAQTDIPVIVNKCINKEIKLDSLVTHEVRLEDMEKGIKLLEKPDCVKVLIKI